MIRRALRLVLSIAILLAALPLVLVPVYAIEGIHPVSTLMLAEHFSFRPVEREWVELDDVAPVLVNSVLMSEDGQFCRHDGIDWGEMRAVIDEALEGEETRGASTIPMQTVKNLFLWNSRSYVRKALEAPLALYADAVLSKRRLMEIYLNIAEWAPGVYGIEAASWHYFDKPAFALTAREAALLAVTLPSPASRNPAKPSPGLRRLASIIEKRAKAADSHVGCLAPEAA